MVLIEREKGDDKGANQKFVDLETQKSNTFLIIMTFCDRKWTAASVSR